MRTPHDLDELQQAFLAAIYGAGAGPLAAIDGGGIGPQARLGIYRHSSELIHLGALRTAYPAVLALVGDAYFDRAAMAFRRAFPALSGNLQGFGEAFPGFLATRPETSGLAYLGDVARLDWLRQACALAADARAMDAATFGIRLLEAGDDLVLEMHPSLRLAASRYPVASIWQYAISAGAGVPPDIGGAGERIAVWRDGHAVIVSTMEPAGFSFLRALVAGQGLSHAHAVAAAVDPVFDLVASIRWLIGSGLVVDVQTPPRTQSQRCLRRDQGRLPV